jgi:sterol desaturase/sphingolipid hydroxylase (fatty acid hydroxylase superfamily)
MLGIPFGLAYANAAEWLIHRYVLHGLGKKKSSFWNFHWGEHHRASRKQGFFDPDYQRSPLGNHAQGKEVLAVAGLLIMHVPLFAVAPWFTATVWYSGLNYLRVHRKAHLDPLWAKQHLKHHYDHHMGLDQDKNWGVTHAWFDVVLGTRVDYAYDENGRVKRPAAPAAAQPDNPAVSPPANATLDAALAPASNDQDKSKTAA